MPQGAAVGYSAAAAGASPPRLLQLLLLPTTPAAPAASADAAATAAHRHYCCPPPLLLLLLPTQSSMLLMVRKHPELKQLPRDIAGRVTSAVTGRISSVVDRLSSVQRARNRMMMTASQVVHPVRSPILAIAIISIAVIVLEGLEGLQACSSSELPPERFLGLCGKQAQQCSLQMYSLLRTVLTYYIIIS